MLLSLNGQLLLDKPKMNQRSCYYLPRDFPRSDQNFSKMVFIIPNFLVLHFDENFMKIRTKIPTLQMHENLEKNIFMQIFMSFYDGH